MTTTTSSVRLSDRAASLKPSVTLQVNARVRELKAEGRAPIGFGAGEPDFDTPAAITQSAIDALTSGQTRYMPVPGEPNARKAIAEKLKRENGIDCTFEHVVISCGAKHSLYLAMQALLNPGDEVIVPTPGWVTYPPIVELCDGVAVQVPGAVENDFKITPAQLEAAITAKTRAMFFNSPSNPCGTMYSPDEIRALADVLAKHENIYVLSDEIYEKIIYGSMEHLSPGSIDAIADRVITINGLSKAYAMTGWRIGYACAPGGDGAIAKAMARLQGQMTSHITSFCYAAIVEALTNGDAAIEEMRKAFASRAKLIHSLVSVMPGVVCPEPTGAFYVFPDVSAHFGKTSPGGVKIDSALSLASALLDEALVAVVPGEDFGDCAKSHIRLSFACDEAQITEGCQRIGDWLGKLA